MEAWACSRMPRNCSCNKAEAADRAKKKLEILRPAIQKLADAETGAETKKDYESRIKNTFE